MPATKEAWLREGIRKKLWLVWLMAAVVAAVLATWLLRPSDSIGPRSYQRIRLDMMEGEVEAILGTPPGNYYTPPRGRHGPFAFPIEGKGRTPWDPSDAERPLTKAWWGEDYALEVAFDQSGRVIGCSLWDVVHADRPTLLDRLRSWLGL
jgi:hypothetical protein